MNRLNRPYTYNRKIKISREDMKLLRAGRKKCTIRMGTASVATSDILISDGRIDLPVRILRIDNNRCLKELTEQDAHDEGFSTREELLEDLRRYYPWARDEDLVTVIYIELVDLQPKLF